MTYKVYFKDGNQKLFEADGIFDLICYLCYKMNYTQKDFYKVEEVR